jgi:anti-anti-sigma factor
LDYSDVPRIVLAGELDVYRREEVAAAFPPPESVDRLVVDMRDATLIDSSIIAFLMRYRRRFVECGGDATDIVVVVPPVLRRVFEITGLVKLLTIVSAAPESATAQEPLQGT